MDEKEKELVNEPVTNEEQHGEAQKQENKEDKHKKKKKDSLEEKLEIIEEELQNVKDKYLRALAEMDNVKKRVNEDLKRERTYSSYTLSDKLIDSLEIFDQALNVQTDDPNFKNFLYGFKMIKDMIYSALEQEGVTQINTLEGETFDPVTEHAVDTTWDVTLPENTIVKVVKKGYKFKDRLLRPAMVVINMKPKSEEPENLENYNDNVA